MPLVKEMGCDQLSDTMNGSFDTLAATLLHEYVHSSGPVRRALRMKNPVPKIIADYMGNDPPNGYGPYNVLQVRDNYDPTNNVDNFEWMALEAYWQRICRSMEEQFGRGRKYKSTCNTQGSRIWPWTVIRLVW